MLTTIKGIVLSERVFGENDKFIDVLSQREGLVSICVKGARKLSSKNSAATQLYTYSKLCFNTRGDKNTLNSSEVIASFFNISSDIIKLSLAAYISELLRYCIPQSTQNESIIRLTLNTFHYLDSSKRDADFLKALFELRLLCELGLMPDLLACAECLKYSAPVMYLDLSAGKLYCSDCFNKSSENAALKLGESELHTLRHIALSDFDKLFGFKLSQSLQKNVSAICEKYVLYHFNKSFKTLEFYKSMKKTQEATN